MRVLLVNPPGIKAEPEGVKHYVKAGSRWPFSYRGEIKYCPFPFSLAYTCALLKQDGANEVKGIDGVVERMSSEGLLDYVEQIRPDLVIMEVSVPSIKDDLGLLRVVKERTEAVIAVCGPFPTASYKETMLMAPWIDFCLVGEYELTANELVRHLNQDMKVDGVQGLVYRRNGEIAVNERRPLLNDLDYLPFPDREDFPAKEYHDFCLYEPNILMMTSRGCPFSCVFCVERWVTYNSPIYRRRKAKEVVDEMEFCVRRFGAHQIYFDDQSFTTQENHVYSICSEIINRKLDLKWTCMGDAMCIDFAILRKMAEAGCVGVKFGIESSDPKILRSIGKPLRPSRAKQVARWLDDLGMISHATYAIGLPGETKETVKATFEFALSLNTDSVQVAIATPFPGTPFYKWAKTNGYLVTDDWQKFDGGQYSVVSYPEITSRDIEELYGWACHEWSRKRARKRLATFLTSPRLAIRKAKRIGLTKSTFRIIRQALKGGM